MNSLRTGDIEGAVPRVRHMPKNLIRERAYPSRYSTNLQPYPHQYPVQTTHEHLHPRHTKLINYSQLGNPQLPDISRSMDLRDEPSQTKIEKQIRLNASSMNLAEIKPKQSTLKLQNPITKPQSPLLKVPLPELKPQSIFRGLGYNIITNSKFEYVFENAYSK